MLTLNNNTFSLAEFSKRIHYLGYKSSGCEECKESHATEHHIRQICLGKLEAEVHAFFVLWLNKSK
jgi:hypothetical protein